MCKYSPTHLNRDQWIWGLHLRRENNRAHYPNIYLSIRSNLFCPSDAVPRFTPKATTAPQAAARSLEESDPKGPAVVYLAKFLAADLENLVLTGQGGKWQDDLRLDMQVTGWFQNVSNTATAN